MSRSGADGQADAHGWLPIESAPRDGTEILCGRFKDPKYGLMAVDWYRRPEDGHGFVGFGKFNSHHWPATHWQPLPKPPVS